jgi:pilus assembly protein CpaE
MRILVSSRSEGFLTEVKSRIPRRPGYQVECVLMINGQKDALSVVDYQPHVLVLHGSERVTEELLSLSERDPKNRPALVIVGDQLSTEAMKLAIRSGARDIIGEAETDQLAASLARLESELIGDGMPDRAQTVAVVNAKGGSGATFIATSLAYLAATVGGKRAVAIDFDFQYAPMPHYLDLQPKRGLLDALAHALDLDQVAVQAYAARHTSGVDVIAPIPAQQAPVSFSVAERMGRFLGLLQQRYETVVIDVPRHLDETAAGALQAADDVLIVLQPTILAVREAVRLKTTLTRDLGIAESNIYSVVNRYSKHGSVPLADIRTALDENDPPLLPSQYKLVNECLDMGIPVSEQAPNSAVAKALRGLHRRIMGASQLQPQSGLLAKTLFRLRG